MGSPLESTIANIFLGHLKSSIFDKPAANHSKVFLRYVDDTLAVFHDEDHCTLCVNVLSTQHKDIKFAIEKSCKHLKFLDIDIKVDEHSVDTWMLHKRINTGLLNFSTMCIFK